MRKKLKTPKITSNTISDYLNWLFFEGEFLVTKNSLLLSFFKLTPHGDYYSPEEDENVVNMWNKFLMLLPNGVTFWYETQKYQPLEEQYSDISNLFNNPVDKEIEKLRYETFNKNNKNFKTSRTLCLAFTPTITKYGLSEESLESFSKLLIDMIGRFASVKITAERMTRDEICTYLHNCISTKRHQIKTPSAASNSLSEALCDDDIDSTLVPLRLSNKFISVIAIDDFPDSGTSAEMLSRINAIDGNIRWITRYQVKDSDSAKKLIDDRRRQYYSRRFSAKDVAAASLFSSPIEMMDTGEVSKYQECELALSENGNTVSFGYYTGLFVYEAETEEELTKIGNNIQSILAKYGFVYRIETLNLFASWLSSLPGNDETCFQPLKNAANHIERCMRFLISIASVQGVTLSASDQEEMVEALKLMIPEHESLSVFRDILQGKNHRSEMVSALSNYTIGGTYGTLFDAEEDTLSPHLWPSMTMLEMGELMNKGNAAIIPALTYIIGQLDELFEDKKPTLLILDEAWVYMRHPVFKGFIETWLKTLRKYNVFVILATQEVSDYDEVIGSVLTNCHTKILLPNPSAIASPLEPLYKAIGLTDTELKVISNGTSMRMQRDYFIMQDEGNAIVDFAITPEQLALIK